MADIFDLFRKIESTQNKGSNLPVSWLIVGLGNPGIEYAGTRHNAGFMAIDAFMSEYHFPLDRAKFHALTGEYTIAGQRVIFMKPQTYMNNSGIAVSEAARFYKIPTEHILVFSDDISLAPGRLRVRAKGSAGGQKGLKSIIEHLGSDAFPRIKIGVGEKPNPEYDLADWVLGKFPIADRAALDARMKDLIAGTEAILKNDFDLAARICNGK